MNFKKFLDKKADEYEKFDIHRMPKIYKSIKNRIALPKIIHIVGTNGKGSSGRFLATYLYKNGFTVGHFSSPHIQKINERFWLDECLATDEELNLAHKGLEKVLSKKQLNEISYFEYLSFLAIIYFKNVDYLVLEAGLGGEYDSTSVFDNILTLVTPIGIDHEEFLGDTIEKIAMTKLKAIQKEAIISKQKFNEVSFIAQNFDKKITKSKKLLTNNQKKEIKKFIKKNNLPHFQRINLSLAIACSNYLNIKFNLKILDNFIFKGRFQRVSDKILVDVGHNLLAVDEIMTHYKKKKVILLYNSFFDKNYYEILSRLKPIIKWLEIVEIDHKRVVKKRKLIKTLEVLDIKYKTFKKIDKNREYLVFGSFVVVNEFLKRLENQRY